MASASLTGNSVEPSQERRPQAESFSVEDLLTRLRDGALRIPRLQRGSRWKEVHRLELFDSIYRGYPVGTLLFWKHHAPRGEQHLGRLRLSAPESAEASWVVDGQQRLTTLAEALLHAPGAGERGIVFDLAVQRFVPVWGNHCDAARQVPVSVLLDSTDLSGWVQERALDRETQRLVFDVGKKVREYRIPTYIVVTEDERVLRSIFGRTHRAGVRREDPEVFEAIFRGFVGDCPSSLDEVRAALRTLGLGDVSQEVVVDTVRAIQGMASEGLRAASAALYQALGFLRDDAGFVHLALLPQELALVVLGCFFHAFPSPDPRTKLLLRRWVWRACLGLRLTGATVGKRTHLHAIVEGDEARTLHNLLRLSGAQAAEEVTRFDGFNFAYARCKLQVTALGALGPRDLRTGEALDLTGAFQRGADDLVRVLPLPRGAPEAPWHGLPRRFLHPGLTPSALLDAVVACQDPEALASHAVDEPMRQRLAANDLEGFLRLRDVALRAITERHFRRQAEWGADDSPALDSLAVDED
ncbi:MAG: DUF262 domain-containing protein [Deltaproteobacteria bacterium]|nr:DUF262 domain-containing protein [Deltaproteobacteria bacterium]